MIARPFDTRFISTNPAFVNALTVPWYAYASGQRALGSFG
jgi:hypothetical protein